MSDTPRNDIEIEHRYAAQETAIRHIEARVQQLDTWARENAEKQNYSTAGEQQKSAVDLHCAVAIIRNALFPHQHNHSGFSLLHGDICPGCELDIYLKRGQK